MKKLSVSLVWALTACGGLADEVAAPPVEEVGQVSQPLDKESGFGVRADGYACLDNETGTCYYPPDRTHTVCLDTATFNAAQLTRVATAFGNAANALDEPLLSGLVQWAFTGTTCPANLTIARGAGQTTSSTNIQGFMGASCASSSLYSESPSIPGTHRACHSWFGSIDANKIDALALDAAGRQQVYNHAVGALMVRAMGHGLRNANDMAYTAQVLAPRGKSGLTSAEWCRQEWTALGGSSISIEQFASFCL